MSDFMAAVKVIMLNKKEILSAAQTTENTIQIIYSLIQSVLSAYDSAMFGTSASARKIVDEDAQAILDEYRKSE